MASPYPHGSSPTMAIDVIVRIGNAQVWDTCALCVLQYSKPLGLPSVSRPLGCSHRCTWMAMSRLLSNKRSHIIPSMAAATAESHCTVPPPPTGPSCIVHAVLGSWHRSRRSSSPLPPPLPGSGRACCSPEGACNWDRRIPGGRSSRRASPRSPCRSAPRLAVAAAVRHHPRPRSGTSRRPPRPWPAGCRRSSRPREKYPPCCCRPARQLPSCSPCSGRQSRCSRYQCSARHRSRLCTAACTDCLQLCWVLRQVCTRHGGGEQSTCYQGGPDARTSKVLRFVSVRFV